jgi:DNA polymerase III subunit alpha
MLLNCHTYYSFGYGTLSTEELLKEVATKGYSSFVLSDINNTSACIDTIRMSEKLGLKPILGIDFRNGIRQQYVGIAKNNEGFSELNIQLTQHLHEKKDFDSIAPGFSNCYVIYPLQAYKEWELRENEFIGVAVNDLMRLSLSKDKSQFDKMVIMQPATFIEKKHFNAHRLLRAINLNLLLSQLPKSEQTSPDEVMLTRDALYSAFEEYPALIANTERILNKCTISFEYGKFSNKNLKHYTGRLEGDLELLRTECEKGLKYRYTNPTDTVLKRMNMELQIIGQMNFASYFLINWDIIQYAQSKNYYYVGRGSGANSMVAYLLRITDVDPIELDLYFERFINPSRSNPPDFDIDFSWTDRDDITRYIFDRFGDKNTALLGSYNTYQHDAVIRELGKVFGLTPEHIDKLQSLQDIKEADTLGKYVLIYSELIKGFPNHLSIHSSGILISEEPITHYSATFIPPKGYPTTQFSMLEAEDIGLYKFDILSQRGLGKIKDALDIIKKNKGIDIDIHDIQKFKTDKKVQGLLKEGRCIGCFYIESPAMRMLLAKLRADDYLRLVAASSIIRPGVSKSGMMREYILRYRDESVREKAKKEIPELYELLAETYGVMVYQEDVIKVAHFFAGLSLAEADYLRRGMSWKFKQRNEFALVRGNFFKNCIEKGYSQKTVFDIWTQIESFANYAFSKGHSASYAVESFQALYLKAYFPLEYMVATLNNGGGFYRTELYVHEARMHDGEIFPPCANNSSSLCEIVDDRIYLGLNRIAGLENNVVNEITAERSRNGLFRNLEDFTKRVAISIEQLRLLIRAGAFQFTGKNKKELLWEIYSLIEPAKKTYPEKELFDVNSKKYTLPELTNNPMDNAFDEIELLGFSLCSPFNLIKDEIPGKLTANELRDKIGKTVEIVGYLVTTKNTSTSNGDRMYFGTFIDSEGNWIDTVHFPQSARQYRFQGSGCYVLKGVVKEEFDFIYVEVEQMHRLATINMDNS